MPLWLHIFNPWIMTLTILVVLILNYGLMLIASFSNENIKHFIFAFSKAIPAFLCAAITISIGYTIMGCVFTFSGEALQTGILSCNYSSMNVLRVPIISIIASAIVGYIISRYILFKKADYDAITRTAMSFAFVIINTPYILIIPIIK